MSHTNGYRCTRCAFSFTNGQSGKMYVLDDTGTRVTGRDLGRKPR